MISMTIATFGDDVVTILRRVIIFPALSIDSLPSLDEYTTRERLGFLCSKAHARSKDARLS